jgi:hypothetical protein
MQGTPKSTQIGIFGLKINHLATLVVPNLRVCGPNAPPVCFMPLREASDFFTSLRQSVTIDAEVELTQKDASQIEKIRTFL